MDFEALFQYFKEWASDLYQNFVNLFKSHEQLRQENFMLRSQLALYDHDVKTGKRPKPKATPAFRQKMVLLSKRFARWKECLPTFKPKTVIKWHKTAFKLYWFKKSKRKGRPPISQEIIELIKQIHQENPSLSPEKIREKLLLKNVTDAPSPNKCFLAASGIKSKRTAIKAPWQNPYAERVIGTLRQELLNHIIPFNERHLHYLLSEYVHKYYNPHRTHLGLDGQTPIPTQKYESTTAAETKLKSTPVLGGLYHTYEKEVA